MVKTTNQELCVLFGLILLCRHLLKAVHRPGAFHDAHSIDQRLLLWRLTAVVGFPDFWDLTNRNGYGSIPIHTIFSGMNIHLPTILMFTRGTRFWHTAIWERTKTHDFWNQRRLQGSDVRQIFGHLPVQQCADHRLAPHGLIIAGSTKLRTWGV